MPDQENRTPIFRHRSIQQPWAPLGAHVLAVIGVIAGAIGTSILIGLTDFAIASLFGLEGGPNAPLWRKWIDEVLVYLLFAWVLFLYHLVFFFPAYLIALWRGGGGVLGGGLVSAAILGAFSAVTVDPLWIGVTLGLFYGSIYAIVFHPLRRWFLGRPGTRKT